MYSKIDKNIAQKWLDSFSQYENSWDDKQKKYTSEKSVEKLFIEKLTKKEKSTGFTIMIISFGQRWTNDMQSICNYIINDKSWFIQDV